MKYSSGIHTFAAKLGREYSYRMLNRLACRPVYAQLTKEQYETMRALSTAGDESRLFSSGSSSFGLKSHN